MCKIYAYNKYNVKLCVSKIMLKNGALHKVMCRGLKIVLI